MVKSALNFAAGFFGSESFGLLARACCRSEQGCSRLTTVSIPGSPLRGPISSAHHGRSAAVQQHPRAVHDLSERRRRASHGRSHQEAEVGRALPRRSAAACTSSDQGRHTDARAHFRRKSAAPVQKPSLPRLFSTLLTRPLSRCNFCAHTSSSRSVDRRSARSSQRKNGEVSNTRTISSSSILTVGCEVALLRTRIREAHR